MASVTTAQHFSWSEGNEKAKKTQEIVRGATGEWVRIVSFSLPQLRSATGRMTCPYAGSCASVCYAAQGWYHRDVVAAKYERNLAAVLLHERDDAGLASALLEDIEAIGSATHVRLHDSGDFFARWYMQAWERVARQRPALTIYAYTKSLPFIDWGRKPRNLLLVQSLGGRRDDLVNFRRPHSRIFPTSDALIDADYVDGSHSDFPVLREEPRIGLVYHGQRRLRVVDEHALAEVAHG